MSTETFHDESGQTSSKTNTAVLHPLIADLQNILTEEKAAYQLLCPVRSYSKLGPSIGVVIDMMHNYLRNWPKCWAGSTGLRPSESNRDRTVRTAVKRIIAELIKADVALTLMWMLQCDDRPTLDSHGTNSATGDLCREQEMRLRMR